LAKHNRQKQMLILLAAAVLMPTITAYGEDTKQNFHLGGTTGDISARR